MKKRITTIILAITMLLCCCSSVFAAEIEAEAYLPHSNIVVHGNLPGGAAKAVTLLLVDSAADLSTLQKNEIAHIGMCVADENGDYYYKFKFRGDVSDYKLYAKTGDGDVTETIISAESSLNPFSIEMTLTNENGKPLLVGEDSSAKVKLAVENLYGDITDYQLIFAAYDASDRLLGVTVGDPSQISYNAYGGIEEVELFVESLSTEAKYVKAFIWNGFTKMVPIGDFASKTHEESFGLTAFENKKDITVAFLGGSITQGTGASDVPEQFSGDAEVAKKRKYASVVVEEYFEKHFENVTVYNAGIGGTSSEFGIDRMENDIISKNPDVVFVEYAVNDASTAALAQASRQRSFESVLSKLLNSPKQPVVIVLYSAGFTLDHPDYPLSSTTLKPYNAYNAKGLQEEVAAHYGIGSIDFDAYVESQIGQRDDFTVWEDWWRTNDQLHPNAKGHYEYGKYIVSMLETEPNKYFKRYDRNQQKYVDAELLDNVVTVKSTDASLKYTPENPMVYTAENPGVYSESAFRYPFNRDGITALKSGESVTFSFVGDMFAISGPRRIDALDATYVIDGKWSGKVTGKGGGNIGLEYTLQQNACVTELEYGRHTVTITADSSEDVDAFFGFSYIYYNK